MKRLFTNYFLWLLLGFSCNLLAQVPKGYYDTAKGQKGKALLTALHDIIDGHKNVGYDGLWAVYEKSDVRTDGTVWDMYSTSKFIPGKKQCGNYKYVGDCYNREHSFPKSWFSKGSPMVSDAFHIYPTDGKVNGQRSNYPYGETSNGTTLASHDGVDALGKLGSCTFPGCSGTVFEPVDEYKGDFARTYFYMATRYQDKIRSWGGGMTAGNDYPCYKDWVITMLLKWHRQDPVSDKEKERNDAVYGFQHNRNPFIDYPNLVEHIWGDSKNMDWTGDDVVKPILITPVDGSIIDMGVTAINRPLSTVIEVRGQGLTEALTVKPEGSGFSSSVTSLSNEDVMNGTKVTVTYTSSIVAETAAVLKLYNKEVTSNITLKMKVVDGIPALKAENIALNSFVARWVNIDGNVNYNLKVWSTDEVNPVFSGIVDATQGKKEITGLEMDTQYHYQLSYNATVSNIVDVRTATPVPVLSLIVPAGGLNFTSAPGMASDMKQVEVYSEYVDDEITASIDAPFELSTDKSEWTHSLAVENGESFYIRLGATVNGGEYRGLLSLSTPFMDGDEVDVKGIVELPIVFFEDFEEGKEGGYYDEEKKCTAATWKMKDVGIWGSSSDMHHGALAARFGKSAVSSMEMVEDKSGGVSDLSFYAALFGGDGDAEIDILYSVDGGGQWTKVASEIISNTVLKQYTYSVNVSGPVRIKFVQTSGKRLNIDDIAMSDYQPIVNVESREEQGWDAFVRQGKLVLEINKPQLVKVYSANAVMMYQNELGAGFTQVELPKGMYIVVCGDKAKKVIIK